MADWPVQSGAAATAISGLAGSNATYTSGTVSITGVGGGITVSSNTGQRIDLSVAAPVAQTAQTGISSIAASNTTYTSGQVEFTGSNAATVKSSANQRVVVDVPVQTAETAISGIVASDRTYSSGTVQISGENNITVHSSTAAAGVQKVLISGPNTSAQQTGISGLVGSNATYTSGTVTITGVGGGITVSSNTGQRIDLSVAAPVAQTGTQFSAGISGGNTSGDTGTVAGRVVLAGGNNITLSGSTNGASETITISGAAAGGAQTAISGVAASNTTYTSGTVSFTGVGGGVTVSSNTGQRVDISVAAPVAQSVQTQDLHDLTLSGNSTSGGAGYALVSSGTLTLAGGPNITLSQDGNHISISGPAAGGGGATISHIGNEDIGVSFGSLTNQALSMQPIRLQQQLTASIGEIQLSANLVSNSTAGLSISMGIYGISNVTRLKSLSTGSQSYSWTSGNTTDSYSGARNWTVPITINATPGDYWVAAWVKTTNAGSFSILGGSNIAFRGYAGSSASAGSIFQDAPGQGVYSATTAGFPSPVAYSELPGATGASQSGRGIYVQLRNIGP